MKQPIKADPLAIIREEIQLGESMFRRKLDDPQILAGIERLPIVKEDSRSPVEVLSSVAANQYWGDEDINVLLDLSVAQYLTIFKKSVGKDFEKTGSSLLFGRVTPSSEQKRQIEFRASEALKMIARESRINRLRVEELVCRWNKNSCEITFLIKPQSGRLSCK